NYNTTYQKRLLSVIYVYTLSILIEFPVFWSLQLFPIFKNLTEKSQMIIGQVLVTVLTYLVSLILTNFKIIKNYGEVTLVRWIATVTIPLITTTLAISPLLFKTDVSIGLLGLIITAMFFVNIIVFYLYDELSKSAKDKLEKELVLGQNDAYQKQLSVIYASQENISLFRHDMKNHLNALQMYISDGNIDEASKYMKNAFNTINNEFEYCKSGNYAIDSILNLKISQAKKLGIDIKCKVSVPNKLKIASFDLNVILANLMDNAINATGKSGNKLIEIFIRFDCEVLYINISNSYDGFIMTEKNKFLTTHKNKAGHGIGIESIKRSINKYNGEILFDYDTQFFTTKVMIFDIENE
ncbi:MAG: GHKL domain-containing protein, partial [Oscillospiraceae bacterium]